MFSNVPCSRQTGDGRRKDLILKKLSEISMDRLERDLEDGMSGETEMKVRDARNASEDYQGVGLFEMKGIRAKSLDVDREEIVGIRLL